jgi:hypothetical protein
MQQTASFHSKCPGRWQTLYRDGDEERIVILKHIPVFQCGACREYLPFAPTWQPPKMPK